MGESKTIIKMLVDQFGRTITYARLAVTDRCNLRCNYCMPEQGVYFEEHNNLLSIEDLQLLSTILAELGIKKIRLTGGEPFVRKNIMKLLEHLSSIDSLHEISITTNAVAIQPYIAQLKELNIQSINVSLDAIQAETFHKITNRDQFDLVRNNIHQLLDEEFKLRINCVVIQENIDQIIPLIEWSKDYPIDLRFLEEMPFNGGNKEFTTLLWNYQRIYNHIKAHYPSIQKIESPISSTSIQYKINGFLGTVGIIPSYSRTFCGSCNRIRVNAKGDIITCLYGKPKSNLRAALRSNQPEQAVKKLIEQEVNKKEENGLVAQQASDGVFDSMTKIGG